MQKKEKFKNKNMQKIFDSHVRIKIKFEKRLQEELNKEIEEVLPRKDRIRLFDKNGEETYAAPTFLSKTDYLYKVVKDEDYKEKKSFIKSLKDF